MKRTLLLLAVTTCLSVCMQVDASTKTERERNAKLKKLDQQCEQARQKKLTPIKEKFTQECIDEGKDPDYCQKRHADYGHRVGKRPPLFYDLPECIEAFEFRKAYRSGD